MPKSTTIETNADKVYKEFMELSTKEMRKALRGAVQQAASMLRGETKKTLRAALPAARKKNSKYNDTILDAVKKSKVEETKDGQISCKVHIMGTKQTGSGTFRAKFYELGTQPRKTRKGYNRGQIKPLYYFQTANSGFLSEYSKTLNDCISKQISKINNRKNGKN